MFDGFTLIFGTLIGIYYSLEATVITMISIALFKLPLKIYEKLEK